MRRYYVDLLGQILKGEQDEMLRIINEHLYDNEYEVDNLFDYTINEAVDFLEENYNYLKDFMN